MRGSMNRSAAMSWLWMVVSVWLLVCVVEGVKRYDGEPVIEFSIGNLQQLQALEEVQNEDQYLFDIWSNDSQFAINSTNQVHVSNLGQASKILARLNIEYKVLIPDVQKLIDTQNHSNSSSLSSTADPVWFNSYHTYESIVLELRRLCSLTPSLCRIVSIGSSIENRQILTIHLTSGLTGSPHKIWLSGGQHAREWVSPATVMYIVQNLISSYGTNPQITSFLTTFEFIITPVLNPDGYDYSWTNTRLWRKNRRNNGNNIYGVDLNRNWNNHWSQSGSSSNPSSDTYHGKSAFSEPETKAASDYYLRNIDNQTGARYLLAIDYHAYGQLVLRPYGYSKNKPPTEAELVAFGKGIVEEIKKTSGLEYENIAASGLYVSSGGADDWFYEQGKGKYVYTIELRDTGRYGFVLPANQIVPTGKENWNALVWGLAAIEKTIPRTNQ